MRGTIALFAGTTEGRQIAEHYAGGDVRVAVSVATPYGASLLPEADNLKIHVGRMDADGMERFLREMEAAVCVDATHPYAAEASGNLRLACERTGIPCLRVRRADGADDGPVTFVDSVEEAARVLAETREGNILITTGSKELAKYNVIPGYEKRCFARVLPTSEALEACRSLGLAGQRIAAMQGPFDEELNYGLMKQWDIRYLVTKQSGPQGGYREKCAAAARLGVQVLTVGRPPENGGESLKETLLRLEEYLSPPIQGHGAAQVALVGIGPGAPNLCTVQARKLLEECDVILGADRLLESCRRMGGEIAGKPMYEGYRGREIAAFLQEHGEFGRAVAVFSGDVGFYSGAADARRELEAAGFQVSVVPGIASPVYFCDRLGIPWEGVVFASLHGRECDVPGLLEKRDRVCVLLGSGADLQRICSALSKRFSGRLRVTLGERLSYPDERIVTGTWEELQQIRASALSLVLLEREGAALGEGVSAGQPERSPAPGEGPGAALRKEVSAGWPDQRFVRGEVPMTKEEIRAVLLAKLRLRADSVLYDVGAGTGSVSMEAAALCQAGRVYAVERNEKALELIRANRERFGAENVEIVAGEAPEALLSLPSPTHVFVGGSGGKLAAIVEAVRQKNRQARFVVSAVTLETLGQVLDLSESCPEWGDLQVVQVSVARGRPAGRYHRMAGENPVWIASFGGERET